MSQTARAVSPSTLRHVMLAAAVGSALEWYDFFIYGTASALVFGELFFPKYDVTIGTLLAFATFAVGFLARPFGGLFFGHFGDRMGRKPMLVATLLLVGGGTFLIGLLPTYAAIGIWAPILLLLLRLVQGFTFTSTTSPVTGEYSSDTAFTDSMVPNDCPCFSLAPTSGSST